MCGACPLQMRVKAKQGKEGSVRREVRRVQVCIP